MATVPQIPLRTGQAGVLALFMARRQVRKARRLLNRSAALEEAASQNRKAAGALLDTACRVLGV